MRRSSSQASTSSLNHRVLPEGSRTAYFGPSRPPVSLPPRPSEMIALSPQNAECGHRSGGRGALDAFGNSDDMEIGGHAGDGLDHPLPTRNPEEPKV